MVRIGLVVKTSDRQMETSILKAIRDELNSKIGKAATALLTPVRNIIISAIRNSPEVGEILTGNLGSELGIPDVNVRINDLLAIWGNSITVIPKPLRTTNKGLTGGVRLIGIQGDFEDVLSSGAGEYFTAKGTRIPWLEWMLMEGDKILVRDYEAVFGNADSSRTGGAIMKPVRRGGWRVPPEYSGTINNNFVTRSIDSVADVLEQEIIRQLESSI